MLTDFVYCCVHFSTFRIRIVFERDLTNGEREKKEHNNDEYQINRNETQTYRAIDSPYDWRLNCVLFGMLILF